jgi:primosomal protein N' (replication factor Y)
VYIITVSPISRGAFTDQLTYWSAEAFDVGSIISVPFRSKHINALVQRCESASDAKMEIKNANFEAKKIEAQEQIRIVRPEAIEMSKWASHYYATHIGSILSLIIPNCALEKEKTDKNEKGAKNTNKSDNLDKAGNKATIEKTTPIKINTNESGLAPTPTAVLTSSITPASETLVVQGPPDDRKKTYKSVIREEFARRKSVVVVAPRIIDAENIFNDLSKGIEDFCFLIHSGLSKKKIAELWNEAIETDHPIVYISTPGFVLIPRDDISVIIIEQESSRVYSTSWPPFLDQRLLIEKYGKLLGARVILGDTLLRIETLYRRDENEVGDLSQASFRLEKAPQTIVVDMNDIQHKDKNGFKIISEELWSMLDYAKKKNERVIIFCSRKGLSPQTVCGDCGKTVMCTRCSAPTVLHQPKSGDRYFLCHHCGEKRSALEACKTCSSWKLTTLGIGIDTISNQIEDKKPDSKIFKLDRDSIKKEADAKKIVQEFLKNEHAILLTTEIGLPFLPIVPHVAVASLDSLFSLPDFRIGERIVHDLIELASRSEKYFLIQTRNADSPLLRTMTGGGLLEFYRNEIEVREKLQYPPFMTFIKLTIQAPKDHAMKILDGLQDALSEWEPSVFPAFTATVKNEAVINMLIKLKNNYWEKDPESEEIRQILQNLPREITVHINPESML